MILRPTFVPQSGLSGARAAFTTTLGACLALLVLSAGVASTSRAQSGPIENLSTFPRATLEIHGRSGTHSFDVWVADTQNRQTQGLMFVRDLPANEGMIFTNCCSGIWMKNTYVALDILFIGADHRIVKIAARAKPFDLTTVSAGQPVKATVELKGGEAAALGLKVGDRVEWQMAGSTATAQSKSPPVGR